MIFYLEIKGVLKQCEVQEPFASKLLRVRQAEYQIDPKNKELKNVIREERLLIARECVAEGAYRVIGL